MTNTISRGGRRRRVLNEEMVAASGTHAVPNSSEAAENGAVYGEAAASDNHARITDLAPRRAGTIWLVWLLSLMAIASLAAADFFRTTIASSLGLETISALDLYAAGSMESWFRAMLMVALSVTCVIIYSIRRHRLDDYRGRYRIWLGAGVASLLLSINSVTDLHAVFASGAAQLSGWTALRDNAAWWLIGGSVAFGWVAIRTLMDLWESRLARVASLLGYSCFTLAALHHLGLVSLADMLDPNLVALVTPTSALVGFVCLLVSTIAYARFVILSADGLITSKPKPKAKPATDSSSTTKKKSTPKLKVAAIPTRPKPKTAAAKRAETESVQWVDGSAPEDDYDDDGKPAKKRLSKSERKRLRKQKAGQRRAA